MVIFPDFKVVLIQMLPFAVTLVALNVLVFAPLLRLVEERKRRVVGYAAEAEEITADAHEKKSIVEDRLASAKAEAAAARARLVQAAEEEGEKLIAAARLEAEKELDAFRERLAGVQAEVAAQLKADAESMSVEIASRILGRSIA